MRVKSERAKRRKRARARKRCFAIKDGGMRKSEKRGKRPGEVFDPL